MLYLSSEEPEKDITMYINSPGGSVSAGMAIFDAMQFIPCDVQTICYGVAASMGKRKEIKQFYLFWKLR